MNLMDMVNGLNRLDDLQPFSPGAFLLAVKMIDLLNGLFWPDTVAIDTNRLSVMAKCSSRNATLNARNELIDRGVLTIVSKGKKGSPSVYRLADLSELRSRNKPNPEPNTAYGMKNEQQADRIGTESGTKSGPNREPNQGHINRPIQDSTYTRQDGHTQPPTATRDTCARAWYDPGRSDVDCDDAWMTNPRARGAIAQRIIDHFPDMQQDFVQHPDCNIHHLLCSAMKAGIPPRDLQEMAEECTCAFQWAKAIVQHAFNDGAYRRAIGNDYLSMFYSPRQLAAVGIIFQSEDMQEDT